MMGKSDTRRTAARLAELEKKTAVYCLVKSRPITNFSYQQMVDARDNITKLNMGTPSSIVVIPQNAIPEAEEPDLHAPLTEFALHRLRKVLQEEAQPIDVCAEAPNSRSCVWYLPTDGLVVLGALSRIGFETTSQCHVDADGIHTWTLRCCADIAAVSYEINNGVKYDETASRVEKGTAVFDEKQMRLTAEVKHESDAESIQPENEGALTSPLNVEDDDDVDYMPTNDGIDAVNLDTRQSSPNKKRTRGGGSSKRLQSKRKRSFPKSSSDENSFPGDVAKPKNFSSSVAAEIWIMVLMQKKLSRRMRILIHTLGSCPTWIRRRYYLQIRRVEYVHFVTKLFHHRSTAAVTCARIRAKSLILVYYAVTSRARNTAWPRI